MTPLLLLLPGRGMVDIGTTLFLHPLGRERSCVRGEALYKAVAVRPGLGPSSPHETKLETDKGSPRLLPPVLGGLGRERGEGRNRGTVHGGAPRIRGAH